MWWIGIVNRYDNRKCLMSKMQDFIADEKIKKEAPAEFQLKKNVNV